MRAKALFDCIADDIGELSFKEGDVLVDVVNSAEEGWYEGRVEGNSIRGLFPYNYVEILEELVASPVPIAQSTNLPQSSVEDTLSTSEPKVAPSTSWSVLTKAETNEAKMAMSSDLNSGQISFNLDSKYDYSTGIHTSVTSSLSKPTTAVNMFTRKPDLISPSTTPIIKPKPAISAKPAAFGNNMGTPMVKAAQNQNPKEKLEGGKPIANPAYRTRSMSSPSANPSVKFGASGPVVTPRSFKDSTLEGNLKLSQLKNQETFGVVLRKTSAPSVPSKGVSLYSTPSPAFGSPSKLTDEIKVAADSPLKSESKEDDNSEDDEGYQLVKPSSLRQRSRAQTTTDIQSKYGGVRLPFAHPSLVTQKKQIGMDESAIKPSIVSIKPTPVAARTVPSQSTSNALDVMSATNNPAPRLPSRPTSSKRQRRPPSSRTSVPSKSKVDAPISPANGNASTSSSPPPIKAKPMVILPKEMQEKQPTPVGLNKVQSPEESKPPSVSNLARQFGASKPSVSPGVTPPVLKPKSSSISYPQVPGKPLNLPNTSSFAFTLPPRPIPKPSVESSSTNSLPSSVSSTPPVLRPKPTQYQAFKPVSGNGNSDTSQSLKEPIVSARPSFARNPSSSATSRKKAAALPPPATASIPRNARMRYEALFESIHDRNKVDGQTVKLIWRKSKLNDKVLADVWKHCDKESTGILDKSAFVQGMGEIDERLRREMLKKQ